MSNIRAKSRQRQTPRQPRDFPLLLARWQARSLIHPSSENYRSRTRATVISAVIRDSGLRQRVSVSTPVEARIPTLSRNRAPRRVPPRLRPDRTDRRNGRRWRGWGRGRGQGAGAEAEERERRAVSEGLRRSRQ